MKMSVVVNKYVLYGIPLRTAVGLPSPNRIAPLALPAMPVEELVTQQIVAVLSAPHMVQAVWDRIREFHPELSEPEVVLPMRNLAGLWQQLFPAEQCRPAKLVIERVVMADGGLEIIWRDHGWQRLTCDLLPGTIGAELQEIEAAA
jgi:site-specific DNA recombinase